MQSLIGASNPGPNAWGGTYKNSAFDVNVGGTTTILNVSGAGRLKQIQIGPPAAIPAAALDAYIDITIDGKLSSFPISKAGVSGFDPACWVGAVDCSLVIPSYGSSPWTIPLDLDFQVSLLVQVRVATPNGSGQSLMINACYLSRI